MRLRVLIVAALAAMGSGCTDRPASRAVGLLFTVEGCDECQAVKERFLEDLQELGIEEVSVETDAGWELQSRMVGERRLRAAAPVLCVEGRVFEGYAEIEGYFHPAAAESKGTWIAPTGPETQGSVTRPR